MNSRNSSEAGFSLIELVIVISLALIGLAIAIVDLRQFNDPLLNGASELAGFIKQVRAKAISATSAYTIQPSSSNLIITEYAKTCLDSATTPDSRVQLTLPSGTYLTDTTWSLCINSRGFPDANLEIDVRDSGGATRTVEVLLGGAVRILGEQQGT